MQSRGRYSGDTRKLANALGEEVHVRHGRGTYVWGGGSFVYTGDFVYGVKHGRGVLQCGADHPLLPPHSVYEGEFVHGEMSGAGEQRWRDGSRYAGQFQAGEMHGEGEYFGADGTTYEGAFRRNVRSGFGILTHDDAQHQGEFFQHKKHGAGCTRWKDGSVHEGEWSFDLRSGAGVETHTDGSSFEGSFANDLRNGEGLFRHAASGLQVQGQFDAGHPALTPVCLKLRVPKPSEMPAGGSATPDVLSARSQSRERRSSKGGSAADASAAAGGAPASSATGKPSKLSKKKQEEARRLAEEQASYLASLTEGVVQVSDGAAPLPVVDECSIVSVQPGHKLPAFYLCACTRDGTVCASESGRTLRVTLRMHPLAPPGTDDAATSRGRSNAEIVDPNDEEDQPVIAFCTCPGAKTVPWPPPPSALSPDGVLAGEAPDAVSPAAPFADDEKRALHSSGSSGSSKKKKSSKPASGKRNKALAVDPPGPPPPFVCDGSCTAGVDRSQWSCTLTRTVSNGFALLDEIWMSGACTPGLHLDLVVEDATPNLAPPPARPSHTAAALPPIGSQPMPLAFYLLPHSHIKLLTAGQPAKKKKKKTTPARAITPREGARAAS